MAILLTGATGFLGGATLDTLLADGRSVVALGRRPTGRTHPALREISGDLAGAVDFSALPWAGIDSVVHLAAAGVKASARGWPSTLQVNVVGTQRLLDAVERHARPGVVTFAARTFYELALEAGSPLLENPYIATKAAATDLARLWTARTGRPLSIGTIFQLYGPGDDSGNVLSYAAHRLRNGEPAIFGSGRGMRDWLYLEDAARAVVAASTQAGEWDIGSSDLFSLREVIERLADIAGADRSLLTFDPSRDRADTDLRLAARRQPTGWSPEYALEDGLAHFWKTL